MEFVKYTPMIECRMKRDEFKFDANPYNVLTQTDLWFNWEKAVHFDGKDPTKLNEEIIRKAATEFYDRIIKKAERELFYGNYHS